MSQNEPKPQDLVIENVPEKPDDFEGNAPYSGDPIPDAKEDEDNGKDSSDVEK